MASFLEHLFLPDHRLAALKIKDYVVRLKSTNAEQQLAETLGVGLHQFLGERNCMLIGFTRSAFEHFAYKTGNTKVAMASSFNKEMLKEYFSTRPGMAKADGLAIFSNACSTYYIEEPDQVAAKFLANIADGMLASEPLSKFPELQQYIQSLLREALLLVQEQAVRMVNSRQ